MKTPMGRRGFTIVEMLMVVGILSVLLTIVTTAAVSSMRSSRAKRTEAMRQLIVNGIATYYAQKGQWPSAIESAASGNKDKVLDLNASQEAIREVVRESSKRGGTPYVNPSALFVAPSGVTDGRASGSDFKSALKGDAHRRPIGVSQMVFGFQCRESGKFRRFQLIYRAATDSVELAGHCDTCIEKNEEDRIGDCKNGSCTCHADY